MKREAETVQVNGGLRVRYHSDGSINVLDGKDALSALKITEKEVHLLEVRRRKLYQLMGDLRNQLHEAIDRGPIDTSGAVKVQPIGPSPVSCDEDLKPAKYCLKRLLL